MIIKVKYTESGNDVPHEILTKMIDKNYFDVVQDGDGKILFNLIYGALSQGVELVVVN